MWADFSLKLFGNEITYNQYIWSITEDIINQMMQSIETENASKSGGTEEAARNEDSPGEDIDLKEELLKNEDEVPPIDKESDNRWSKLINSMKLKMMILLARVLKLRLKQSFNFEWNKNFNLLSLSRKFPTSFGFPLKLALNGSTFLDFKLTGDVNMQDLSDFTVQANILPR